ncbi:MAG: hypothetical protein HKN18_17430 [Silicimonas sp.]|nr:hypothetical protein [Silicimonas sp.]
MRICAPAPKPGGRDCTINAIPFGKGNHCKQRFRLLRWQFKYVAVWSGDHELSKQSNFDRPIIVRHGCFFRVHVTFYDPITLGTTVETPGAVQNEQTNRNHLKGITVWHPNIDERTFIKIYEQDLVTQYNQSASGGAGARGPRIGKKLAEIAVLLITRPIRLARRFATAL